MKYITPLFMVLSLTINFHGNTAEIPPLQHSVVYQPTNNINKYWISEKLDGVRGYWDGKQLLTRKGNKITSPKWFTKNWPGTPLDGELWIARGKFQQTVSCVRRTYVKDNCWQKLYFLTFDLPEHKGTFSERIQRMKELVLITKNPHLGIIEQFKLPNADALNSTLKQIVDNNGEGLMLHFEDAHYKVGRNHSIMKLKMYQDAEAIVLEHIQGKGKYTNMLGSLLVKTPEGIIFKIGTGFSDLQRSNPPEIGSTITYKYVGKTLRGVPRFASFQRIRP